MHHADLASSQNWQGGDAQHVQDVHYDQQAQEEQHERPSARGDVDVDVDAAARGDADVDAVAETEKGAPRPRCAQSPCE